MAKGGSASEAGGGEGRLTRRRQPKRRAADGEAVEGSESDALARHAAQQRHERASEARARAATATAEASAADGTAVEGSESHALARHAAQQRHGERAKRSESGDGDSRSERC